MMTKYDEKARLGENFLIQPRFFVSRQPPHGIEKFGKVIGFDALMHNWHWRR